MGTLSGWGILLLQIIDMGPTCELQFCATNSVNTAQTFYFYGFVPRNYKINKLICGYVRRRRSQGANSLSDIVLVRIMRVVG